MNKTPASISALIDEWPTIAEFAADIGCKYEAARQMRLRESIAPTHFGRVIAATAQKGIEGVDWEWLAARHASAARASA